MSKNNNITNKTINKEFSLILLLIVGFPRTLLCSYYTTMT